MLASFLVVICFGIVAAACLVVSVSAVSCTAFGVLLKYFAVSSAVAFALRVYDLALPRFQCAACSVTVAGA